MKKHLKPASFGSSSKSKWWSALKLFLYCAVYKMASHLSRKNEWKRKCWWISHYVTQKGMKNSTSFMVKSPWHPEVSLHCFQVGNRLRELKHCFIDFACLIFCNPSIFSVLWWNQDQEKLGTCVLLWLYDKCWAVQTLCASGILSCGRLIPTKKIDKVLLEWEWRIPQFDNFTAGSLHPPKWRLLVLAHSLHVSYTVQEQCEKREDLCIVRTLLFRWLINVKTSTIIISL